MHKRFRELAQQAVVEKPSGFREFDANRFAQLIVLECAYMAELKEECMDALVAAGYPEYDSNFFNVGWYIRKEFGVDKL